ncbi:MAG: DUF1059 domain-containing protein [Terriglobales bacterium]
MHQTPDVPGTSPVTDNPNPGNTQGADTTGPGTDTQASAGERNISANNPVKRTPDPGGDSDQRTFRCADVGNADCRWEVKGSTEEELMPNIERHARTAHGADPFDERMRNLVRDAIRARAA